MKRLITRLLKPSRVRPASEASGAVDYSRTADQDARGMNSINGRRRWRSKSAAPQPQPPLRKRPLFWLALLISAGVAGGVTRGYRTWDAVYTSLPDTSGALTFERRGTITMVSADGAILQKLGPASQETLTYEELPEYLVEAFIAAEDHRFYEHNGIDFRGIGRAVWANVQRRDVVEGASTITQQLARIVFLDQQPTLERKLREAIVATRLEQDLTKQQIIERYLNLVYLGGGAYGVADAAWIYFGKSAQDLTLAESALVAGLAPAPSVYSPLVNPEAARVQRDRVISRMLTVGVISQAEAEEAWSTEINTRPREPKFLYSEFPYFTIYVQKQLAEILTPEQIEAGGLTIETTLNVGWQRHAEAAVEEAIELGQRQRYEQASLVAIDPRNGEIKAMVGGNDFNESQFNRVTQAQRQPGSTFKTFVYTTAIAAGFSPYREYVDAKYIVDGYEPNNYGNRFRGNVDLLGALQSSINVVAVKLLVDVGFEPVIEVAQRMGIRSSLIDAYSLALGSSEVNLLELTSAYGTLASQGKHVPVHGIRRVLNSQGEVLYQVKHESVQAIDADTANIMTWMLEAAVQGGTGGNAALADRPVAGKTGTSERFRDLWFVGYIPQLATGVWLGNDDSTPTRGASSTAAYIWRVFMRELTDEIPAEEFPERPSLRNREATVEAKPVKPGKVVAASASEVSSGSGRSSAAEEAVDSRPAPSRASRSEPEPEPAPPPERERPAARPASTSSGSGGSSRPAASSAPRPAPEPPPSAPAAPPAPPPPIEAPPPAAPPAPAPPPPPPAPAPPPLVAPADSGGAD